MLNKAMYTGVEAIMDGWKAVNCDSPYFSVWINSKDIGLPFNEADIEKAEATLRDFIELAAANGHNDLLIIKIHPKLEKGGYITNKTPVMATLPVRVTEIDPAYIPVHGQPGMSGMPYGMMRLMESVETKINNFIADSDTRLKALETEALTEAPEIDMLGRITGLLENPVIGNLLQSILPAVLNKIPGIPAQPLHQVAGIDGTDVSTSIETVDQEFMAKLDTVLTRLSDHCDLILDLTLLADLAEQKPDVFKMLLLQLRNK